MGVFPKPMEPVSCPVVWRRRSRQYRRTTYDCFSLFRTVAYVPKGKKFQKKAKELCDEKKSSSGNLEELSEDENKLSNIDEK